MFSLDLHTHSVESPDGGLSLWDYTQMLASGRLQYIGITDHGSITFALEAQAQLGDAIIVGEEIMTQQGEVIGLFIKEAIPSGLSASQAIRQIHRQGGLVYIPHPFESVRSSLSATTLEGLSGVIDIVETFNGRALTRNKSDVAKSWAAQRTIPGAASSDAHGVVEWGKTKTLVDERPTAKNLTSLLGRAEFVERPTGLRGALYPKANRFKKRWGRN